MLMSKYCQLSVDFGRLHAATSHRFDIKRRFEGQFAQLNAWIRLAECHFRQAVVNQADLIERMIGMGLRVELFGQRNMFIFTVSLQRFHNTSLNRVHKIRASRNSGARTDLFDLELVAANRVDKMNR